VVPAATTSIGPEKISILFLPTAMGPVVVGILWPCPRFADFGGGGLRIRPGRQQNGRPRRPPPPFSEIVKVARGRPDRFHPSDPSPPPPQAFCRRAAAPCPRPPPTARGILPFLRPLCEALLRRSGRVPACHHPAAPTPPCLGWPNPRDRPPPPMSPVIMVRVYDVFFLRPFPGISPH